MVVLFSHSLARVSARGFKGQCSVTRVGLPISSVAIYIYYANGSSQYHPNRALADMIRNVESLHVAIRNSMRHALRTFKSLSR